MSNYKDFFISYGRTYSLAFVGRLHQALTLHGKSVWFDKVNIHSGERYQERINAGIRDAQNFIFVMSPSSVTSPYCLKELKYAAELGKRILPIFHVEESAPTSVFDPQLNDFRPYNLEEQQIRDETFLLISERDWVYALEAAQDISALVAWKEGYENHWPEHESIDFLKEWQCPICWSTDETLESCVKKLLDTSQREYEYVWQHTDYLNRGYDWLHETQNKEQFLLVGEERQLAEEWLLTEFKGGTVPCEPSRLHANFICASKQNAFHQMTDVYLAYHTANQPILQTIDDSLAYHAITTWRGAAAEDTQLDGEQRKGIERADNFLFLLSEDSLASAHCIEALQYAQSLHKRIIPLKVGIISYYEMPAVEEAEEAISQLLAIRPVDFTDNVEGNIDEFGKTDIERDIDDILRILRRNQLYYHQHKVLLVQAILWQRKHQPTFLLSGHNLDTALAWLQEHDEEETHPPTDLHRHFINVSAQSRGLHPPEVFISYSRRDADFARKLNRRLQEASFFTWFDQESIASGTNFYQEILRGIEASHNFVFIISPDALQSGFCEKELQHAAQHHKRFIPILWRPAKDYDAKVPEEYQHIEWINFHDLDIEKAFQNLQVLLNTDREYLEKHVKWQQKALDWENNHSHEDFLLNPSSLVSAEAWIEKATAEDKDPPPTNLQHRFIEESKRVYEFSKRKEKKRIRILRGVLAMASVMFIVAAIFGAISGIKYRTEIKLTQSLEQKSDSLKNEQSKANSLRIVAQARADSLQSAYDSLQSLWDAIDERDKRIVTLVSSNRAANLERIRSVVNGVIREHRSKAQYEKAIEQLSKLRPISPEANRLVAEAYCEILFIYSHAPDFDFTSYVDLRCVEIANLAKRLVRPTLQIDRNPSRANIRNYITALTGRPYLNYLRQKYYGKFRNVPGTNLQFGETEVTIAQWNLYIYANQIKSRASARFSKDEEQPVVYVTVFDAVNYCNWLSKIQKKTPAYQYDGGIYLYENPRDKNDVNVQLRSNQNGYRLPRVREWKQAVADHTQLSDGELMEVAWLKDNSNTNIHAAKEMKPNQYSLFDMLGNVSEWCWADQGNSLGLSSPELGGHWQSEQRGYPNFFQETHKNNSRRQVTGFRVVALAE